MNAGELIAKYIQGRDLLSSIKAVHKSREAEVEKVLDMLEAKLLEQLNALGAQHISSAAGTVYRTEQVRANVADWPVLLDWVKAGEHWEFLERRVSKSAVEAHMEETKTVPPGVNISRALTVNVRRS